MDDAERRAKLEKLTRLKELKAQREVLLQQEPEAQESYMSAADVGLGTLAGVGKALDVQRGATTGPALAGLLEAVTGKDVYRPEEQAQAIDPRNVKSFPPTSELLERAGVPELGRTSDLPGADYVFGEPGSGSFIEKGGALDFTGRGALGTLADVVIDPATYQTFGAAPVSKAFSKMGLKVPQKVQDLLTTLTQPFKTAQEGTAKTIYKQGLRNIDRELEVVNKAPLAEELMKRNVWGNSKTIKKGIEGIKKEGNEIMDQVIDTVEYSSGAKVPIGQAAYEAQKIAQQAKNSSVSSLKNQGKKLDALINSHLDKGLEISPRQAKKMYTDLGGTIDWADKGSTLENIGKLNLQQGIGKSLDKAISESSPDLLSQWIKGNSLYSSTKTVDRAAMKGLKNELGKPAFSQVAGGMAAASLLNPQIGAALAGKEATRFLFSPTGATTTGHFMKKAAPLTEIGAKRMTPVWQDLYNKQREEQ